MAYLHRETYDIVQNVDCLNKGDYFRVDDLLAETLQALNSRGYRACDSSVSLPFDEIGEVYLKNVRDTGGGIPGIWDVARAYSNRFPKVRIMRVRRIGMQSYGITRIRETKRSMRISFVDKPVFQRLPKGFCYSEGMLEYSFSSEIKGIAYMRTCIECSACLYEWACSLPIYIP